MCIEMNQKNSINFISSDLCPLTASRLQGLTVMQHCEDCWLNSSKLSINCSLIYSLIPKLHNKHKYQILFRYIIKSKIYAAVEMTMVNIALKLNSIIQASVGAFWASHNVLKYNIPVSVELLSGTKNLNIKIVRTIQYLSQDYWDSIDITEF